MGKAGDELSIRGGVDLEAGDKVVTVKSITKVDGPQRVYNLEVASLDGQITHNYFVGEDKIWTHNVNVIKGFTRHGLNQIIGRDGGRGVSNSAILDAVNNPTRVSCEIRSGDLRPRFNFFGRRVKVVVNSAGEVITAFGKSK